MKIGIYVLPFIALVGLSGCQSIPMAEDAASLDVSFEWSNRSRCSSISPEIKIGSIPSGTSFLKVKMIDLDKPSYPHGGGEVSYTMEPLIAEGALKSYTGPCPPNNPHRYEFTVQALNTEKNLILGEGKSVKRFPE